MTVGAAAERLIRTTNSKFNTILAEYLLGVFRVLAF